MQILYSENSDSKGQSKHLNKKQLFQRRVLVDQLQEVAMYLYHLTG